MFVILFFLAVFAADVSENTLAKTLLQNNDADWQSLTDTAVPLETQADAAIALMHQLEKTVPKRFIAENQTDYQKDTAAAGNLYQTNAAVIHAAPFAGKPNAFRCKVKLQDGSEAEVITPSVPAAWQMDKTMSERCRFTGLLLRKNNKAVFITPAIRWYPNTFLGNLNFDVGSFDKVPVKRVTEIDALDDETKRTAFKLTENDNEPFYGLLQCLAKTLPGTLEREARSNKIPQTDLFNNPAAVRGTPVLLFGTAKRIIETKITDENVRAVLGLEKYYQIYLFTDESQGNPVVVCVSSLPERMTTGDASDFAVNMAVAAVPYKLWIYDTAGGQHYAPLLIGRCPIWNPDLPTEETKKKPNETFGQISVCAFFVLLLVWYFLKWRNRTKR
ncbi:MAG: hypothetical protein LBT89_01710 [Planctomycetaceae bacterium]|jgi:hypothetical protein|nr:hypothetical protein [Planctomycetaceae bacterium]